MLSVLIQIVRNEYELFKKVIEIMNAPISSVYTSSIISTWIFFSVQMSVRTFGLELGTVEPSTKQRSADLMKVFVVHVMYKKVLNEL